MLRWIKVSCGRHKPPITHGTSRRESATSGGSSPGPKGHAPPPVGGLQAIDTWSNVRPIRMRWRRWPWHTRQVLLVNDLVFISSLDRKVLETLQAIEMQHVGVYARCYLIFVLRAPKTDTFVWTWTRCTRQDKSFQQARVCHLLLSVMCMQTAAASFEAQKQCFCLHNRHLNCKIRLRMH